MTRDVCAVERCPVEVYRLLTRADVGLEGVGTVGLCVRHYGQALRGVPLSEMPRYGLPKVWGR